SSSSSSSIASSSSSSSYSLSDEGGAAEVSMTGRPAASAFAAIFSSISAVAGSSTDGDLNEDFDIEDFDVEDLDDEDSDDEDLDDEDLDDEDLEDLDEGFDGMKTEPMLHGRRGRKIEERSRATTAAILCDWRALSKASANSL